MEEASSRPADPAHDPALDPARSSGAARRGGLPTGSEVGGYRILARLGAGAMGAVYEAEDGGGNLVAIKFLHAHLDVDAQGRERLRREAVALQRLRHPAVAQILDVELDGSEAFIVTELVDGPNLEEEIATGGPLDARDLFELADQLAEALEAVHAAGVVHRDLKPSNVLVTENGPVLIDFGIAHGLDEARATSTGLVMGTPGYLAPELLEGAAPSANSDWWGWAALLAFSATGRPPFGMRPVEAVLARARSGEADLDGLGPRTAAALAAALRADPASRLGPSEVAAVLHRVAQEGDGPTASPATGATAVVPHHLGGGGSAGGGGRAAGGAALAGTAAVAAAGGTLAAAERAAAVGAAAPAAANGAGGGAVATAGAGASGAAATVALPASAGDVQPTSVVPTVRSAVPVPRPTPTAPSIPPLAATQIIANDGRTVAVPTMPPTSMPPTAMSPTAVQPAVQQPTLRQPPAPSAPPGAYPPAQGPYPPPSQGPYAPQPAPPADAPASGRRKGRGAQVAGTEGGDPLDAFGQPLGEVSASGYARPAHRRRAGTVAALGLPLVLLAGTYPGIAFVLLAVVVVVLRVVGVGADSFHGRRERKGVQRSDGVRSVVAVPWYALRAVVGAVPSLLVALCGGVLLVVGSWWLLAPGMLVLAPQQTVEARSVGGANEPWVFTVVLCVAMVVTVLLAWFGPLSGLTRYGARTTLAHVAPGRVGAIFLVLAGLVLAAIVLFPLGDGAPIDWAPFPGPPPSL
ncbi:serine/threonine protein kinase [Oerskovia turbata]|uniref:Serine/threonine protein kinase n=1 Tax=Oerskovia turbata TaxID=1713 RepID=A0A4Q1L0D6_9CELL|nr:serine/threonine-protein kinase [Oerskovia turbata]RXR26958.1 serine/threonine protein kinase [Oerskovia turbata]RXR36199.1 serine/threonine protein kinase [Oerskovia turbata]